LKADQLVDLIEIFGIKKFILNQPAGLLSKP
jgi:hypothetical protein